MLNEWLWQKETERGGKREKREENIEEMKYINLLCDFYQFCSVQSLSRVRLFATPSTAPREASLSIANSRSLLKLMSTESVMPSNYLILYCPLLILPSIFPSIRVFSNESVLLTPGGQSIGVSASASVLPGKIQDWFPLGLTSLILQSNRLSRVFSNITFQKHQFFGAQLSSQSTLTSTHDH